VAKHWPRILENFGKVERIFNSESYKDLPGCSLRKRLRVTASVLLTFALFEHLMSWSSYLYERFFQMEACKWKIGNMFHYLTTNHLGHIYYFFPVNIGTAIWAEYMNISFTFVWNFIDLFIILICLSVASKFEKINKRIQFYHGRVS
jgi:gustatory receptor